MVRSELIKVLGEKAGKSQKEVKEFLDLIDETTIEVLKSEDELKLGLYTIKKEFKQEREGRNPATGEPMTIPARNAVKAKIGKKLKDAVK